MATEIRTMRKRRTLRQSELAVLAKTGQSAVSRIEKEDYDSWTFKTLINIAIALKARLRIHLEPIEDVISAHRVYESDGTHVGVIVDMGETGSAALLAKGGQTPQYAEFTQNADISGLAVM